MSARQLSTDGDRMARTIRDLQDEVAKLRSGAGNVGQTSFGSLRIGSIEIDESLDPAGGDHLIFRDTTTAQAVPFYIQAVARAVTSHSSFPITVGASLVAVAMSVTVEIPSALAAITDVKLTATIPSVVATGGNVKVGWIRNGSELARLASVASGVTVPVAFTYLDRGPGAGTWTYSLAALISAGAGTLGDGNVMQVSATLVPAAT